MAVDVDKSARLVFEILGAFFPERAIHLGGYITEQNAKVLALEPWREQQLVKFIGLLVQNVDDMTRGYLEKRVTKVAWAVRNILELSVWINFCNASDASAKQFHVDAARDLEGFRKAIQKLEVIEKGAESVDLARMQKELAAFAQKQYGLASFDDDYTKVAEAAKALGMDRFPALFKLYSKFAHPTSLAVNSVVAVEADAGIRLMFLEDGAETSSDALTTIREFAIKHLPLPVQAATL